jgi:uncharacterized membrane protein YhaH (DUF805 family)
MGFKEAVRTCLKQKYATFQGRASRSEYWYFMLFYWGGMMVLAGVGAAILFPMTDGLRNGSSPALILVFAPLLIFFLACFIPSIAASVRRFHDRDLSGWWVLGVAVLGNVPYLGLVVSIGALVIYCLKGTAGPNRFGRDPLGSDYSAEVFA